MIWIKSKYLRNIHTEEMILGNCYKRIMMKWASNYIQDKRRMGSKYGRFIKKLMKTKKATVPCKKPVDVKILLRDLIANLVQNVINFYKGNGIIELKPEMFWYYLGEFSLTYKRVSHNKYMEHLKKINFF